MHAVVDWGWGGDHAKSSKSNSETILVGCSKTNELKLFERASNFAESVGLSNLTEGCFALDYANQDNRFAFGGGDGTVYIMKIEGKQ